MSRRFDTRTNLFNPNGRINQIEYALKAIKNSGPALALHFNNGIVIATEKRTSSSLLMPPKHGEKLFRIDDHVYVLVSGLTADANYLIEFLRKKSQDYKYTFGSNLPIEQLVEAICNLKQSYTQFGGMRPFGTSFIFIGWDHHYGFQVYTSDPSGNMASWRAIAQGANEENSNNLLQENFEEDMGVEKAKELGMQVIMQTMDTNTPETNRLVLGVLTKEEGKDHVQLDFVSEGEKDRLIKLVNEKNKE